MNDRRFEAQALPHLDAAYNLARWLARSPAEADDIVQEAMLRALKAFGGFRGENAKPWLLAIVRNCWINRLADIRRRRHMPLPDEEGEPLASDLPDPEAAALRASQGRLINGILATLPEEFREVLILREMEELSYREISEVLGVPTGTVMSRLFRARTMLREKWLVEDRDGLH